jgi:DNA polymerase-3 subunit epsilon
LTYSFRTRPFARRAAEVDDARWVVLDVESSGLDPVRDRLLAIAAVALHRDGGRLRIALADSFEVVLAQGAAAAVPDKANILLHGIGVGAQRSGAEPAAALRAFEDYAGRAPRLGWHAAFDRALIDRAARTALGRALPGAWLDLAELAPLLCPQVQAKSLDDWLEHFGIRCAVRHQAAADALATAELLLRLWPALRAEGATSYADCARLAARRRWLG